MSAIGLSLIVALCLAQILDGYRICATSTWCRVSSAVFAVDSKFTIFTEDEEELRAIAEKYLLIKYKGGFTKDKEGVKKILMSVLPPVTPSELNKEVESTMAKMTGNDISQADFLAAFIENSYWKEAGALVVKELIYLDCLQSFYFKKEKLLDDEDFDSLKDMLTWEGSSAISLSGWEARFISGVAAHRRGVPIMDDAEYETLKADLQKQNSWVTARMQDPLERMGLETFMGYLHRQMAE